MRVRAFLPALAALLLWASSAPPGTPGADSPSGPGLSGALAQSASPERPGESRSPAARALPAQLDSLALRCDSLHAAARFPAADSLATQGLQMVEALASEDDPRPAAWLRRKAKTSMELARLAEAEDFSRRALAREAERGEAGQPGILEALRVLYEIQREQDQTAEAETTAQRSLSLSRKLFGPGDVRTAEDLWAMAQVHLLRDDRAEGSRLLEEAIHLVEQQRTADDELLGELLCDKAMIASWNGHHPEAAALGQQSLEILERHWGPDHPKACTPLLSLSVSYRRLGDFPRAEEVCRRALRVRLLTYGPEHPLVAATLNNLGVLLAARGKYAESAEALERCLDIRIATSGERHRETIRTMTNVAATLATAGKHGEALQFSRRAAALAESVLGPEHSLTAFALNGLARGLRSRGSIDEAEVLYRRILRIEEHAEGGRPQDPGLAQRELAVCLILQGRLEEAQEHLERAIDAATAVYGPDHFQVARHQRYLGHLLLGLGRAEQGRAILEHSLSVLEQQYGPVHWALLPSLEGLTHAHLILGDLEAARGFAERAVAIGDSLCRRQSGLPVARELVTTLLADIAVDAAAQAWPHALAQGMRATDVALHVLDEVYPASSENEALIYGGLPRRALGVLLATLESTPAVPDTAVAEVFGLAVRTHGQILDRLAQRRQLLEASPARLASGELFRTYSTAAQRVANLLLRGSGGDPEAYRAELARAHAEKEAADRALSEKSLSLFAGAHLLEAEQGACADSIAAVMDAGMTLVQFVRYAALADPRRPPADNRMTVTSWVTNTADERYGAFVLAKTRVHTWRLDFRPIGSAARVDSLILAYRRSIDEIRGGQRPSARQEAEFRAVARELHDQIGPPLWDILRAGAPPAAHGKRPGLVRGTPGPADDSPGFAMLVPTSLLHLVDFNTLLSADGEAAIERWRLHYLSSATDLLRLAREARGAGGSGPRAGALEADARGPGRPHGSGLLAVGNPAAAATSSALSSSSQMRGAPALPAPPATAAENADAPNQELLACLRAGQALPPLLGAEQEAQAVAGLFRQTRGDPAAILIREAASERAVTEALPGKEIVHLAAHGFFCEAGAFRDPETGENLVSPLVLAGIVLAAESPAEDGVLTAQEIAGYDLRDLDWVVLSACGSALGTILPGEGPCGLRRAFEMAGARTVLMALWRVDDLAMRELMERIYAGRLAGRSTLDAVRDAELARLRDCRARWNRIHPALWAGVIAEGDWR